MKLEDVQTDNRKEVVITIRTTKQNSEWMKRNKISPSLLFDKSIIELQQKIAEEGLSKLANPNKKRD